MISLLPAVLPLVAHAWEDDWIDRLDAALTGTAAHGSWRARISGTVEVNYYRFDQPAPGLIEETGHGLFDPRLVLFVDAQAGVHCYFFAQARIDNGFDPGAGSSGVRLDEYALRITPGASERLSVQMGKFATVVGQWVKRHQAWDSPFVFAPLAYENPTGIFDETAARSAAVLRAWGHVGGSFMPAPTDEYRVPVIWGPSYASGISVAGRSGHFDYATELKNTALSSRPDSWDITHTQLQNPAWNTRLGWRPDLRWSFGVSFGTGVYLRPSAARTLPPGRRLGDYRQDTVGLDASFAWRHWQLWGEGYRARFAVPGVGAADTWVYFLEAKYKFTPQLFGAVRWNRQTFSDLVDASSALAQPWGADQSRLDLAVGYRFTAHTELKLECDVEHGRPGTAGGAPTWATQFVVRF
ncbi:MAG: hypothetical protein KF715_14130 [Candidatus Didemnitutus sp.]|nr:hypothetical protein [Candidatus Didemnitutus sp.]